MSSQADPLSPDTTVADIALQYPGAINVFEKLGIDYCCGGRRPVGAAVAEKGLDWHAVAALLQTAAPAVEADDVSAWADASLSDLIGHILSRYHATLRDDLPRLTAMGAKVVNAHGDHHPEVRNVASTFAGLRAELDSHMMKEEQILFPFIEQLEAGTAGSHPMLGHLASPIAVMEREHDNAGMALATLRDVTAGYSVPSDGCTTFHAYYSGLAALERDLHAHIHLENNILFPRGSQIEARVLAAR